MLCSIISHMTRPRYLESCIKNDLAGKMVFVAGPRQVGKTTLARRILEGEVAGSYFKWDNREDRREIRQARWPGGPATVVLDELHKWRSWKGWVKGEYDKHGDRLRFLITGSAQMDIYRRGGDSLQGRYHHYRLHPFSYREDIVEFVSPPARVGEEPVFEPSGNQDAVEALMEYGGFSEPFLAQSARTLRRWQRERLERFFREDVRDLESVRHLSSLELLVDLIHDRVSSPLSLNSLRKDLEASHRALTHWMEILERLYYLYRVPPFASTKVRSLRKMPKVYLWDWSMVRARGPRFENLIASHLLKLCHYLQDREGYRAEVRYLRDRHGREVDFLVLLDRKPWFAVEAKVSETAIDPNLAYFRDRLKIPWTYQVVLDGARDFIQDGVRCLPARQFLTALI